MGNEHWYAYAVAGSSPMMPLLPDILILIY